MTLLGPCLATFLVLAGSTLAQAVTLQCSMRASAAGGGYITDVYVLQYDATSGQAIVSDGLILYYNDEQPMQARVSEDTSRRLVLTWKVRLTNSSGQAANMQFRAAYFRDSGAVVVRATPGGDYSDSFEGRGTCRPV